MDGPLHAFEEGDRLALLQRDDGLLPLDLGRVAVHLERVLTIRLSRALGLLGDERTLHDVLIGEHHESDASSFFAESAVSTSTSCFRMSKTLSPSAARKSEPSRLRRLRARPTFAAASTTSALRRPSFASTAAAVLVFGATGAQRSRMTSFWSRTRSASAERSAAFRTF